MGIFSGIFRVILDHLQGLIYIVYFPVALFLIIFRFNTFNRIWGRFHYFLFIIHLSIWGINMNIIMGGFLLGTIVFMFFYVASKKSGQYFLAPIITFLFSLAITAYGLFAVGGFEGMGYGLVGVGFVAVSIIGTLLLPIFTRRGSAQQFTKRDKASLILLPLLFFSIIVLSIYLDDGYWIIEQGGVTYVEDGSRAGLENYYKVSTILEGKKKIDLMLGKDFLGKEIEVENVSKWGSTEITLNIVDGEAENKAPYISIGLDEIKEPLTIQTTDGMVFESVVE